MGKESVTSDTDSTSADLSSPQSHAANDPNTKQDADIEATNETPDTDHEEPLVATTAATTNASCVTNSDSSVANTKSAALLEQEGKKENIEPAAAPKPASEFKLRIVPLEKLLEKPPPPPPASQSTVSARGNRSAEIKSDLANGRKSNRIGGQEPRRPATRVLPERANRRSVLVIELTDSSSESESSEDYLELLESRRKPKNPVAAAKSKTKTKKKPRKSSESAATAATAPKTDYRIRRCVVRIKRCKFPSAEEIQRKRTKTMNGGEENSRLSPTANSNSNSNSSLAALIAAAETATRPEKKMDDNHTENTKIAEERETEEAADEEEQNHSKADDHDEDSASKGADTDCGEETSNSDGASKSSGSEVMPVRKKRVFKKRRNSDSDFDPSPGSPSTQQPKKRSRIVKKAAASDDSDADGDGDGDDETNKNKRKHIRKIIKTKDLDISTKTATKEEEERRKRIEERQRIYNQIYVKPESTEVSELVLDFDEETKEPLLAVDKGLLKKLKPHQVSGVKFMWDACFETVRDTQEKSGSGCILAHCMGLGKTLQIVTLSHTLISNAERTHVERVLIISPLSTLNNWAREFQQWMGYARNRNIEVYDMSRYKDKVMRIFKLNEWFEEGGVCILGYDMYRILANEKAKGLRKKQRETLQKALVEPGPDLVVCDEGHLLKNEKTSISKAVTKMRTKRRIVLTGTPLQNNLKEYYCMIQFVKPNLLGTYKEYLNRFVNPITNGQYTDSTDRDIRLMKHRSHILHKMLEGCIQRRDYSVLAPYLPVKNEYVVYTTLSPLQQTLYEYYMCTQRELSTSDIGGKGARLFQDFQDLRRIWTHPMNLRVNSDTVIRKRVLANDSDSLEDFICDDDDDEAANSDSSSSSVVSIDSSKSFASGSGGAGGKPAKKRKTRNTRNVDGGTDSDEEMPQQPFVEKDDPSEWWKRFVEDKELNNIHHSPKLVILMRLLQECEKLGDKVLVFSQSLQSLDVIEHFLSLIDSRTKGHEFEGDVGELKGFWTPGYDYFRLDGSCSVENREAMCKKFNNKDNLRARLFLISTRAGGLGINLVAANRVVIFDVSWNPSHDTQSIFRVYRFGQEKPCYIYRLIAMGTMEQKVYERQVAKQATAKRVIDEQQISRHYNQSDLQELYTYELKPSVERGLPLLPKDRLFAELLSEHADLLFKYHEHDSLLENDHSENLSESERQAAWDEYEAEKTRAVNPTYAAYSATGLYPAPPVIPNNQYGNASGSVTSNKIFGFRSDVLLQLLNMKIVKDRPELTQNQVIQLVPAYLQTLYSEMNNGDPTMYKDLLALHTTLSHSSGMYMNPLLYANQNPGAAGYAQSGSGVTAPAATAPGFEPDKVYEID